MPKIPILINIDVEPDERSINPNEKKDWEGFMACYALFSRFRTQLEAKTRSPVHFSWFIKMDPQIAQTYGSGSWAVDRYASIIRQLETAGDHIGLHVHPWRWESQSQDWVEDFANQEWVDHSIRVGADAFQASLSRPCLSFRMGDRWMNNATVELLETLGVQVDLSIEPGQRTGDLPESFTGSWLDVTNVPRQPYHPSKLDFRQPAADSRRNLWIVPTSTGSIYSPRIASERYPASTTWVIARNECLTTGIITASPNPIPLSSLTETGATTLEWSSQGTKEVQVHVNAPDGPLFSNSGPSGKGTTGKWVTHGMVFYLQDISDEKPLTAAQTLATVRVNTVIDLAPKPANDEYVVLNLGLHSHVFCRIMDHLLQTLSKPYISIVMRSDSAIRQDLLPNLEESLDHITNHPLLDSFDFETPIEMVRGFNPS